MVLSRDFSIVFKLQLHIKKVPTNNNYLFYIFHGKIDKIGKPLKTPLYCKNFQVLQEILVPFFNKVR